MYSEYPEYLENKKKRQEEGIDEESEKSSEGGRYKKPTMSGGRP